jgi:glycosyltransferase involved in cell wall biosynthesis
MPRVLHIIDSLEYQGGVSQLRALSQGLLRHGYDVHVCTFQHHGPQAAEFAAAGVTTVVVPRRWRLDPLADCQLARHVRRLKPDVVHTWNTVPGMFGPIAARCPLVAGYYHINRCQPGWEWAIERRFARRASRLVTNSEAVRGWCVQNGIPAERLTVIPSGVPATRPSDISREELLKRFALPPNARLVGVVGQLIPEKRVQDLIWAADLLRVLHDNLRVLIIGDGPLRAQLEEYARLASDLEHIRFLGAGDDVWRIMPHLDALWNGSENVSQSAAILEAMAAHVPVVASDTPTNRELIIEGETGHLIPLGTRAGRAARARHTDRIISDEALAKRLTEAARNRVHEHFDIEQFVRKHIALYEGVGFRRAGG